MTQRPTIVDVLFDGDKWERLEHLRVETNNTHGTGCTLAAAITAELAKGKTGQLDIFI